MQEKYLQNLINEYKNAMGYKNVDVHSPEFLAEITEWVAYRQIIAFGYISLLNYMDAPSINNSDTVEIGKCFYDSCTNGLNTSLVTPYSKEYFNDGRRLFEYNFSIENGEIFLVGKEKKIKIPCETFLTYMTQNPYNYNCIKNWDQIHNSGRANIIVGVYGENFDKDKKLKIEELKLLKEKLFRDYKFEYEESNGTYLCAIASKGKVKTLTLENNYSLENDIIYCKR